MEDILMKNDLRKKIFVLTLLAQTTLSCACVGFDGENERFEDFPLTVHSIPVAIDPILQIQDEQEKQKSETIYFGKDKVDPSMEGLADAIAKRLTTETLKKGALKASTAFVTKLEQKGITKLTEAEVDLLVVGMRNTSGNISKESVKWATNNIDTFLKNGLTEATQKSLKFGTVVENGLKDAGETLVKEGNGALNQMGNAVREAGVTIVKEGAQTVTVAAQTAGSTAKEPYKKWSSCPCRRRWNSTIPQKQPRREGK